MLIKILQAKFLTHNVQYLVTQVNMLFNTILITTNYTIKMLARSCPSFQ